MSFETLNTPAPAIEKKEPIADKIEAKEAQPKTAEDLKNERDLTTKELVKKAVRIDDKIAKIPDEKTRKACTEFVRWVVKEWVAVKGAIADPANYQDGKPKKELQERITKSLDVSGMTNSFMRLFQGLIRWLSWALGMNPAHAYNEAENQEALKENNERNDKMLSNTLELNDNLQFDEAKYKATNEECKRLNYEELIKMREEGKNRLAKELENKKPLEWVIKKDSVLVEINGIKVECSRHSTTINFPKDLPQDLKQSLVGTPLIIEGKTYMIDTSLMVCPLEEQVDLLTKTISYTKGLTNEEKTTTTSSLTWLESRWEINLYQFKLFLRLRTLLKHINKIEQSQDKDEATKKLINSPNFLESAQLYNVADIMNCVELFQSQDPEQQLFCIKQYTIKAFKKLTI